MKIVTESTGWKKNGEITTKIEGCQDAYSCTITSYICEANKQRYKIMEDSLMAVIRPKPFWLSKRLWWAIVFWVVCFERIERR